MRVKNGEDSSCFFWFRKYIIDSDRFVVEGVGVLGFFFILGVFVDNKNS